MTTIPWQDGDVLTAGSLRLVPQLYGVFPQDVDTFATSANMQAIGSVFISGGQFTEFLIPSINVSLSTATPNATTMTQDFFLSGAGLGGGSIVQSKTVTVYANNNNVSMSQEMQIPAGAGWIAGSDAWLYYRAKCTSGGPYSTDAPSFRIYGTGGD